MHKCYLKKSLQAKGKASRSEACLPFIRDWVGAVLSLECISALEKHLLLEEAINNNEFRRTACSLLQKTASGSFGICLLSTLGLSQCLLVLVGEGRGEG